jgi:hypothetical protein
MVIAAPRSGTTWASVWLTTDATMCLHDPLWENHYTDLDNIQSRKMLGISCTGIALFPEWLNAHPARKVILHRDIREVNASLQAIGLLGCCDNYESLLFGLSGHHCHWQDIFRKPKEIYEFLLQKPFDAERHAELVKIEMQPNFEGLTINPSVTSNLIKQVQAALH